MKHFYLYLMVIIGIMFLNGCSKDDDNIEQTKTEVVLPKEVYRLQIVEAKFSEPLSSQEEYDGNLGETPIKLVRADDHTLIFYVQGDITVGEMVLTVPQLDVSHTFNVKNPTLKGSAETVLQPIFEKTMPEYQQISTPEYANYLTTVNTAFNDYYKTLSQEEKNNMALFYQVNETFFADVLNPDLQEAKGVKQTVIIATKFTLATALFVGGSMTLTLPGTPVEKAIIGIASVTAAVKAWDYGKALINQVKVITKVEDDFSMDKPLPKTLGSSNLTFENDKTRGVNLYTKQRNMISGDRASAASGLAKFFGTYEELMNVTKKVNSIVSFINDHVFFVNIPSIPISEIPNSTETETTALTEEAFGYMTFSVADSNVKITEKKFEKGTIRMKMTIINPATVTGNSIKTQLNYTYKEEFSNVIGSFPVEITLDKNPFIGTWSLIERDGYPANEFVRFEYYEVCSHIPSHKELFTGTASFTESTFNISSGYRQFGYKVFTQYMDSNNQLVTICHDPPALTYDVIMTSNYGGTYDYQDGGMSVGTLTNVNDEYCEGYNPTQIQVYLIDENTISVTIPGNCVLNLKFERQ